VEDDQAGDESSYSVSTGHPGGIALSDSEKAEALSDTLDTQFQPVADLSFPAVIEMFDVALRSYFQTPASEPKLANPDEVHEAIRGLKVGKASGTVYQTKPCSFFPSERYPSCFRSSTQFSAPITFPPCGSTLG
jgi:hypothetical protein